MFLIEGFHSILTFFTKLAKSKYQILKMYKLDTLTKYDL